MPVTTYTTIGGEIVSQDVNGTVHDLLPDPLGHTVGLIGSGQGIEFEYTYWPYEEVGYIDDVATALRYVGTLGYYSDDYGSPRVYVRARHYRGPYGRWLTVDPLWPEEPAYAYSFASPLSRIDPTGGVIFGIGNPGTSWWQKPVKCYPQNYTVAQEKCICDNVSAAAIGGVLCGSTWVSGTYDVLSHNCQAFVNCLLQKCVGGTTNWSLWPPIKPPPRPSLGPPYFEWPNPPRPRDY